jgi:hypothetical protein
MIAGQGRPLRGPNFAAIHDACLEVELNEPEQPVRLITRDSDVYIEDLLALEQLRAAHLTAEDGARFSPDLLLGEACLYVTVVRILRRRAPMRTPRILVYDRAESQPGIRRSTMTDRGNRILAP